VLAHNSVDRGIMARDSIELNLDEPLPSSGKLSRVRKSNQQSAFGSQPEERSQRSRAKVSVSRDQDDSELLINREDLDLEGFNIEDLDSEEAQFLRTDRRVSVRRSPLPKKTARWLKTGGVALSVVLVCGGLWKWAEHYATHSPRFHVDSSDAVEISGVRNAPRAPVMDVAGDYLGRNIFYPSLDETKRKLEQIPWVEHASVMRLLPNRVAFTIEERTPVAFVQIASRVSLIDANGVVMGMPANRQTRYSFPVIRGITETEPLSSRAAAMKIYNRLVGELGSADGANYIRQLSEVDLSDPEDVKVTANDPGGTMVVYLGKSDFLPRYKLYVAHIAEWRRQFQNLQSVDLKFEGQMVVNPDRPGKTSPLMNTDNTDKKKTAAVRPVTQKAALKPVSQKALSPAKKAVHHGGSHRTEPKKGSSGTPGTETRRKK
jgi:cell division protein FtsQ